MVKDKFVRKFFVALLENGGSMTHYDLARKVFGSNWSRAQLDELVNAPLIAPLLTTSRQRVTRVGRVPLRYVLVPQAWPIAERWRLLSPSAEIPPERLRLRLEQLAQAGNEWAEELQRMANYGRKKLEEVPPPEKKKRHRSERQLEKRRQWAKNKEMERLRAGTPAAQPSATPAAPAPSWAPSSRPEVPRVVSEPPVSEWQPSQLLPEWMRPATPAPRLDKKTADLVERIRHSGYQVDSDRGLVRYDNKFIPVSEWMRLMPDALS